MAQRPIIENALHNLRPGASWGVVEGEVEWYSEDIDQPSSKEIQEELDRLKKEWDAIEYSRKRKSFYPPITEQLDMIYWDMVNGTSAWKEQIDLVKFTYPKGDEFE
jgi:hypothetical protein